MSRPLNRLLVLRQRLKDAAQMELAVSVAAKQDVMDHLDQAGIGADGGDYEAAHLQFAQTMRELAVGHLELLERQVEERRQAVALAKQQERQVEILVQKRAAAAKQKEARRQSATLDDWYRASTWEEPQ
jgi:flagellar biosynthesis chaperone FliJ